MENLLGVNPTTMSVTGECLWLREPTEKHRHADGRSDCVFQQPVQSGATDQVADKVSNLKLEVKT